MRFSFVARLKIVQRRICWCGGVIGLCWLVRYCVGVLVVVVRGFVCGLGVVWCGAVRCGAVWCGVMRCCCSVSCRVVSCRAVLCCVVVCL